jgi:hypothetical protein
MGLGYPNLHQNSADFVSAVNKRLRPMGGLQKTKTPARIPAPLKKPTRLPIHYYTLEDTFCQEDNEEGFQHSRGLK